MASQRHWENGARLLESIPNEILIEILSYLSSVDAVVAFSNLNTRFQRILIDVCCTFDFTSISKTKFDYILKTHSIQAWRALKLSDAEHTPGQVFHFFENHSLDQDFPRLRSLSIVKMSFTDTYPLMIQLPSLSNLVSLEIESVCGDRIPEFQLPHLKRLTLSSCAKTAWFKNFPALETVQYTIARCRLRCTDRELVWPRALKHLKILYKDFRNVSPIQNSLMNLSDLLDLEIYQTEPDGPSPDGNRWRQIISQSLPSLKTFQFLFQFFCRDYQWNQLRTTLAPFFSSFYTVDQHRSVCCDVSGHHETRVYYREDGTEHYRERHILLYTIPFTFQIFPLFKTHLKTRIAEWSRHHIDPRHIDEHTKIDTLLIKSYSPPELMFTQCSVVNLILRSTFDPLAWAPTLTHLRHVTMDDGASLTLEDFHILLSNAPELDSLTAKKNTMKSLTDNWTDICICQQLSRKIRSLTFASPEDPSQAFDGNELERIFVVFSSKCHTLSLGLHSHINTIDLILRRMPHLISLHVYNGRKNVPTLTVEWLEEQNPRFNRSNCTIRNVRHDHYFWLG